MEECKKGELIIDDGNSRKVFEIILKNPKIQEMIIATDPSLAIPLEELKKSIKTTSLN